MLNLNSIYHGNCLDLMKEINNGSIDMILCDLPYGTTKAKWDIIIPFDKLWEQYTRILKENGVVVLTGTEPFSSMLRLSNLEWYKYDWVWNKKSPTGFLNAKKQPLRVTENISVFYKKQPTYNPQITHGHPRKSNQGRKAGKCELYNKVLDTPRYDSTDRFPINLQTFSSEKQKSHLHPTQKPVELFRYLIRTYTNKGDLVLDNCIGSGTTAIACLEEERNFIGIEKEQKYYDIALNRINKWHLKPKQINLF